MRHSLRMVIDHAAERKANLVLSVKLDVGQLLSKKDEPRFPWQPEMCAASVVGCGGGKPHINVRPLSLAALELAPVQFHRVCAIYSNAVHGENWRKGVMKI